MKIVVICEDRTEAALKEGLREYVQARAIGKRCGIKILQLEGHIFQKKLQTTVKLSVANPDVSGVVVLTDVYPKFKNAADAKSKLSRKVQDACPPGKFRAHAAQFELEAWLLPFWDKIAKKLKVNAQAPGAKPEQVNNEKPPSKHFEELFRRSPKKCSFQKAIEARTWLTAKNLEIASQTCPELKSFLDSLLEFAQLTPA